METTIEIKIDDDSSIHWILNSLDRSSKIIIFVHWLWGKIYEHIFFNWYKFFTSHGFDTFRLNLYYDKKLTDNTISNHSNNLTSIIDYFKNIYDEIYLVGHSLWWPVILLSNIEYVKKVVLRDPVLDTTKLLKNELHYTDNSCYVSWWMDILIWDAMKKEILSLWDLNSKLSNKYSIIYAETTKLYNELTVTEIKNIIIPNSDHNFHIEWMELQLFEQTLLQMNNL